MIKDSSTFISGLLAVGMYVLVIVVLLFYFNTRDEKKSVHYVKKNQDRIRVSLATPTSEPKKETKAMMKEETSTPPKVAKRIEKEKIKQVPKKQKETSQKVIKEKVVKEKVVKNIKPKPTVTPKKIVKKPPPKKTPVKKVPTKKSPPKKVPPKKVNKPKDLFASISSSKVSPPKSNAKVTNKPHRKNVIKVSEKASASTLVNDSLKIQKTSDRGIENAYFARIEEKLKGWPAQSNYAGEMAKVWIKVDPSGHFVFKVTTASGIDEFNMGLIAYLKQLQRFGFGPHKGDRPYTLNVEFVATD